jgi:hypothetical protein
VCLAALGSTAAGCDDEATSASDTAIRLGPTPAKVMRTCRELQRRQSAPCPLRFPRTRGTRVEVQSLTPLGYRGYLASFNVGGFASDDGGHVLLAAQPRPLELSGRVNGGWPAPGDAPDAQLRLRARGGFRVVERTTVGAARALVVRAPPYPAGGVHGGHVIVLWNRRGRGYVVSLHFTDHRDPSHYPERARVAAALSIARSMTSDAG